MQIKQQRQNFQVQICGKNKSCTNKCVTLQIISLLPCWEVQSAYILCEANSGLLRSNIPPLHFFFRIAKVLVPTFPIASLGILDWIKFLSGRTSQLTHLSRMRLKRSVAIWNRQKYNEDYNGPASQWVNPYVCVVIADEIFAAFSLFDCFVLFPIRDICHGLERHLCSVTRLKKNAWKWCEE